MFVFIRELLAKIRLLSANFNEKQKIVTVIGTIILTAIAIVFDYFVFFNPYINIVRAGFSLLLGGLYFSFGYLIALKISNKRLEKDSTYKSLRDKFSYIERRNISVVFLGLWFLMLLMVSKPGPMFTVMSSVMVALLVTILSFWRSTREETAEAAMGLRDRRDVEFEQKVQEEMKERQRKEEELKERQ